MTFSILYNLSAGEIALRINQKGSVKIMENTVWCP